MIFDDAYQELAENNREMFVNIMRDKLEGSEFNHDALKIIFHQLPFYPDYMIIEAKENQGTDISRTLSVVAPNDVMSWSEETFILLDGTNKPIYLLNETVPVKIDQHTVLYYVPFFFAHVRAAQGIFHVVQSVEDIHWHEEPAPAGKSALSKLIEPIEIKDFHENDITLKANIIFKDSLFESDIRVQKNGIVSLSNQEILVEDLPIHDQNLS